MASIRMCSRCGHSMVQVIALAGQKPYYQCVKCGHTEYAESPSVFIQTTDTTADFWERKDDDNQ